MPAAVDLMNRQYLLMRERVLSLAADFDRLQRAEGGDAVADDPRHAALLACLRETLSPSVGRAERVQMLLSDQTPPPAR
jgi:hypothetical protein